MTTTREQLITLMHKTLDCDLGEGETSQGVPGYGCFEHETDATDDGNCTFAELIVDAVLAAGWQAPIEDPEELTDTTFDERMQAIADTATRPRTHLTEICADLVEIAKNPALAAHKDLADQIREIASHL